MVVVDIEQYEKGKKIIPKLNNGWKMEINYVCKFYNKKNSITFFKSPYQPSAILIKGEGILTIFPTGKKRSGLSLSQKYYMYMLAQNLFLKEKEIICLFMQCCTNHITLLYFKIFSISPLQRR